jgi:pimeloyl-ACP methyl ester carboxylesterase/DNA-binding winged helix-turn-helix (wHTH) protein
MRYLFEDCELDTEAHELRRAGAVQAVQPQVFDLIRLLVQNPDRLITRDELIARIWGGRIVSEAAIDSRINAARKAVGDDGARQAVIRTVARRGIRFVAPVRQDGATEAASAPVQTVRFCRSADGTRIAYGFSGTGPKLLRAGHWLTHLEHDWHSPIWRPFLDALGRVAAVVRYDQRGTGLSERAVDAFSLDTFVDDLAAVVDAAGLDRFPIYATSQGVPVAIEYAARHPERVSGLILHGGFARGRLLRSEAERAQGEAYITLMRHGWAEEGSQFLQAFASIFIPDGTPEQIRSLVELQRISTDAATAVLLRRAFDSLDVTHRLAEVAAPALVIHGRNDGVHPLAQSMEIAATLPNAELLVLETRNHVIPTHDPVWPEFLAAVQRFLAGLA